MYTRNLDREEMNANKTMTMQSFTLTKLLDMLGFGLFFSISMAAFTLITNISIAIALMSINVFATLPAAAVINVVKAIQAYREASLKNWRPHPALRFGIELLSAVAIGVAVIGAISSGLFLYTAVPYIFAAVTGLHAAYSGAAAIYSLCKGLFASTEHQRSKSLAKAAHHAMNAVSYGLLTAGIVVIFGGLSVTPFTFFLGGALAIAGGALGAAAQGFRLTSRIFWTKEPRAENAASETVTSTQSLSSTKRLGPTLGFRSDGSELSPDPYYTSNPVTSEMGYGGATETAGYETAQVAGEREPLIPPSRSEPQLPAARF